MPAFPPGQEPGWKEDPWSASRLRWWDGRAWTGATQERWVPAGRSEGPKRWPWVLGAGLVLSTLSVVGIVVALILIDPNEGSDEPNFSSTFDPDGRVPTPPPTTSVPPDVGEPGSRRLAPVGLGQTVTVRDQDGERVRATMLSIRELRPPPDAYVTPPKRGFHLVGLRLRLEGAGPGLFDDNVGNATRIVVAGRAYESLVDNYDGCPELDDDRDLATGDEASGCLIFSLPRAPRPSAVRYWPSSGYGPDVATWRLR